MNTFFTIITATYNAAGVLPRLLASLEAQTCQDFVWVCQDGASTDDTLAIAKEWEGKISTSIASEKDTGIYDAWNKAIAGQGDGLGEWVLFLGADDLLAGDTVLQQVKEKLLQMPETVVFGVGEIQYFSAAELFSPTQTDIDYAFKTRMLGCPLPHTGLFSKGILLKKQKFDSSYRICGDHNWIVSTWDKLHQAAPLHMLITKMSYGGISSSPSNKRCILFESIKICRQNFPQNWLKYALLLSLQYIERKCSSQITKLKPYCLNNKFLAFPWRMLQLLRRTLFPMKY